MGAIGFSYLMQVARLATKKNEIPSWPPRVDGPDCCRTRYWLCRIRPMANVFFI